MAKIHSTDDWDEIEQRLKAGVDKSVIKEITGHAPDEMFDRYNTVDVEDTREAVDQLEDYFANVAQTVTQEATKAKNNGVTN